MNSNNLKRYIALFIFLFTLLSLSLILPQYFESNAPFDKYPLAAKQYISGNLNNQRIVDHSPLYLHLNILAQKYSSNPYQFLVFIQIVLASLSSVLFFLLLHRFFNLPLSVLGAMILATNKTFILYTLTLEPEPLMIFFILGFLFFASKASAKNALAAGIFLSVSLMTRQNFIFMTLIYPILLFRYMNKDQARKQTIINFLIPIIITIAALGIRNSILTNKSTFFGMSPGAVFFEGNNPLSKAESGTYPVSVHEYSKLHPTQADYQHEGYRYIAELSSKKKLSVRETNLFWTEKTKNFFKDEPIFFIKQILKKPYYLLHSYRRHDLSNVFYNDNTILSKYPSVPFALISAMAVLGLLLSFSAKKFEWFSITAVLLLQSFMMHLGYISDRQRAVIIAPFIFFAIAFLSFVFPPKSINGVRKIRWNIIISIWLVTIMFFALNNNNDLLNDEKHRWKSSAAGSQYYLKANKYYSEGETLKAKYYLSKCISVLPYKGKNIRIKGFETNYQNLLPWAINSLLSNKKSSPSQNFDLAYLYLKNGQLENSQRIYQSLLKREHTFNRQFTQSSLVEFYLARIAEMQRNKPLAIKHLKEGLAKNPGEPWILAHLYAITNKPIYRDKLVRYFNRIDANIFINSARKEIYAP